MFLRPRPRLVVGIPRSDAWKTDFNLVLLSMPPSQRLPRNIRKGRAHHIHPDDTLRVRVPQLAFAEAELSLAPSIYTTEEPRHRFRLPHLPTWLFICDRRRCHYRFGTAIPNPKNLQLGDRPCAAPSGVTIRGLVALACYLPHISGLSIHFQVATLGISEIPQAAPHNRPTTPREECALTHLDVGSTHLSEESTLVAAKVLLRIFPVSDPSAMPIRVGRRLRMHSSFPNNS